MGRQRTPLERRRIDYICFEISKPPLRGAGMESRQVFEALEKHAYFSYSVDKETGKFSGPVHDIPENWTNFFASAKDMRGM